MTVGAAGVNNEFITGCAHPGAVRLIHAPAALERRLQPNTT